MAESYTAEEYALGYPPGIESHFWNIARHDALQRALRNLPIDNRLVMDVGCGIGITTRFLAEKGFNIRGVELGDAPVPEECRDYISTGQDLFTLPDAQKQEIHCVLLLDVIEHIAEREKFLTDIHDQLPNCRHLVVTVPARRELWGDFDNFWGHRLRYDRPTLAAELNRSGFSVRTSSYYFHLAYFAGLLLKLVRLDRGRAFESPHRSRSMRLLHGLLGFYGRLENRLVPGCVPGSSILCVASRSN